RPPPPVVPGGDPEELVTLEEVERRYILRVMEAAGGHRTRAAQVLGLDRKTLYRKLAQYARAERGRDRRPPDGAGRDPGPPKMRGESRACERDRGAWRTMPRRCPGRVVEDSALFGRHAACTGRRAGPPTAPRKEEESMRPQQPGRSRPK